ncbi:hypothetical protein THSYN_15595 [Candidatus Thiodictyon syntrophicum]|uniref:histidine kinase n=1 Tax=Candidatus Thiodictyon syntrophicum TaxID=1166950 RepID=A0A2K8UAZ5_9GAMM|nr:hypothetical protein THSYN_15595 [Candidatus Thiodictyon syntrophicum]
MPRIRRIIAPLPAFLYLIIGALLLVPARSGADTPAVLPLALQTLPAPVHSWEEAARRWRGGGLPPAQNDIHLGFQPQPRYFAAPPPGRPEPDRPAPMAGQGPILKLTAANLDLVELVYLAADGILAAPRQRTGDTLPLSERDLGTTMQAFRLDPRLITDHALLLRVTTTGNLSLVPRLLDATAFATEQARAFLTGGMLLALATLFSLIMLAAWAASREVRFLAFVLLSVPFNLMGLAVTGQLPYFLPFVDPGVLGRAASVLNYILTAASIFAFDLIVRPPPAHRRIRRFWRGAAWLLLLLAPTGLLDIHPWLAPINRAVQLGFIAFLLVYGPWQWRRTSTLGRIALAYLITTCLSAIPIVARPWLPQLASLAVAWFWQFNLLLQSLMLVAVLIVGGRILREVPEQTRRMQQAEHERVRLAAVADKFSGLLQVVSHEVRNPASSLRLLAGNLRRGLLSNTEAADDLTHLSNHLVDIVQSLQAQRAAFATGHAADFHYDLHAKVEQVQGALGGHLDLARLDLAIAAAPDPGCHLIDAPRLVLILGNLLDNAFKYGGPGRVRLALISTPGCFRIDCTDQGPGLAAGEEAAVFEQFWRGARSRHITGWGLGLWACRNAVESLGGTIVYRPQSPAGAGFHISVERRPTLPPTAP